MRHLLVTVLLLAAPISSSALASEWLVTYAATEEQAIESSDSTTPPRSESRSYTQTIALAEDSLVVEDDRQKIVHDFAQHRLLILNLASNTYEDWSLFSTVDFFAAELSNRNMLGAGMRAAKVAQAVAQFDRFDNETALRLASAANPHNSPKPVIERVNVDHRIEFRCHERTAVHFTSSKIALPAEIQHRFVNYLAYSCAIHPEIRRAIADSAALPEELVFTWRNVNRVTTTTLRLVSAQPAETDHSALPTNATPAAAKDDPVSQVLVSIHEAERTGRRPTREDAIAFADGAIAKGRPLDGLMALLEYGLQSGEQLPNEIRRHRAKFDADTSCQIYLKAFDQSSQAACERGLAANASIVRTNLRRAYMLDLQRANHLDRLRKASEAQAAYLIVLRANPFHAGALHDLGHLLAHTFNHPTAWRCWDTARHLSPDHPMLKDIAERQQQLISLYPDFF